MVPEHSKVHEVAYTLQVNLHSHLHVCRCKVLVLHSAMQSSDQKKVFNNYPRCRKVVSRCFTGYAYIFSTFVFDEGSKPEILS